MRAFICRWMELELTMAMAMAMLLALEQLTQPIARSTAAGGSNVALVSAKWVVAASRWCHKSQRKLLLGTNLNFCPNSGLQITWLRAGSATLDSGFGFGYETRLGLLLWLLRWALLWGVKIICLARSGSENRRKKAAAQKLLVQNFCLWPK